jgi:STE24 endopeptidase
MSQTVNATIFSSVFLGFLFLSLAFCVWLSFRHMAYVKSHRNAVPAEFAGAITLDAHQKAADYTIAKQRVGILEGVIETLLLIALTLGGGMALLFASASSSFTHPYAIGLALFAGLAVVSGLVGLPFDLYRTFVIEERFGFNKMNWTTWFTDALKGIVLSAALGIPLLLLVFWLMEKMGSLWWLYVWLAWLGFSLLMLAIYPNFIAPLFNKFQPLSDDNLKSRIDALLARCGFSSSGLFVMDGSKRSSHGNAYFTGFGKTKRIVFFDTLIERLTPSEIEAVLAHELGHFKRKHIAKRIVAQFGLTLLVLGLMGWIIDKPWFYEGLGFPLNGTTPHVAVSLLLFFMALPVFTFWFAPVGSIVSRQHEFEADAYAAEQADANDLVSALVKLYRDNAATLTPDPLHSAVYDSHPPATIRVAHLKKLSPATHP